MQIFLFLLFLANAQLSLAVTETVKNTDSIDLNKLVVKGTVPGPDLWRITDGDNELWILGTLSPLPKKMKWNSKPVEEIINTSQAFMLPPSIFFSLKDIGFFKKLSLAKSAIGIKKNPEKEKLIDILPKDIYSRWLVQKKKYIGNSKRIEKQRPIFASNKLFDKALNKTGLTKKTGITKKLLKTAKKNKIDIIRPTIEVNLSDPKLTAKKFKKTQLDDITCFSKTLERIETDLSTMKARALAWSYGDVKTIQSLPYAANNSACNSAIFDSSLGQDLGLEDSQSRLQKVWLDHATSALKTNKSTFAIMPISYLLNEQGILKELEAAGFEIEVPSTLIDDPINATEAQP